MSKRRLRNRIDADDQRHHFDHGPRGRRGQAARLLEVAYEDEDVAILIKPAGLELPIAADGRLGMPATGEETESDRPLFGVLPLDPGASGIVAAARSPDVRDRLLTQLADGSLDYRVLALVRASFVEESGTIDQRLSVGPKGRGRPCVVSEEGSPAITEWTLRDSFVGFALLECRPRTAMPAQIRAHLAQAAMPPAVDPAYGSAARLMLSSFKVGYRRSRSRVEKPLIQRLTLHAASVAFRHPTTGEPMRFEAPIPKDMKAALHQLDRFGRLPPPTR